MDVSRIGLNDLRSAWLSSLRIQYVSLLQSFTLSAHLRDFQLLSGTRGSTWIPSANLMMLDPGMLSNDHISWMTRTSWYDESRPQICLTGTLTLSRFPASVDYETDKRSKIPSLPRSRTVPFFVSLTSSQLQRSRCIPNDDGYG